MKFFAMFLMMLSRIAHSSRDNIDASYDETSWLTDQRFGTIIKYSYTTSVCCNILVDGKSRGVDKILTRFIKLYDNKYTTDVIDYACHSYFLASSSEENLIELVQKTPTSLPTMQIIMVIDSNLTHDSHLLDASLFRNSNVNIISRSSTWSLSENFKRLRVFKEILKYDDMKRKGGVADLQGRQLQVATHYLPPFSYLQTAVRRNVNGIEGEFFVERDESELAGIETQIFLIIAEKMNFTWTTRTPTDGSVFGRANGTNWNGGLIGLMFRREIDLAYCQFWLLELTQNYVNLSFPWYQMTINFLVPRPKPIMSIWALSRPLSLEFWMVLLMAIIIHALVIYWSAKVYPNIPERFTNYIHTLIELIGRLLGTWAPKQVTGVRIHINIWHFFGVLIVTAYSSNLAAILTGPDYEPRIDTIRQFVEANLTWGRKKGISNFIEYFDLEDKYAKQMADRFYLETSDSIRECKIRQRNYGIFGKMINKIFFPERNVNNTELKNYRVMQQATTSHFISFIAQPWLIPSINRMLIHLNENGLTSFHLQRVIDKRVSLNLREVLIEKDTNSNEDPVALRLKPLFAAFMLLFAGHLLASIVFYFELKKAKATRSPMKVPDSGESSRCRQNKNQRKRHAFFKDFHS